MAQFSNVKQVTDSSKLHRNYNYLSGRDNKSKCLYPTNSSYIKAHNAVWCHGGSLLYCSYDLMLFYFLCFECPKWQTFFLFSGPHHTAFHSSVLKNAYHWLRTRTPYSCLFFSSLLTDTITQCGSQQTQISRFLDCFHHDWPYLPYLKEMTSLVSQHKLAV